MWSFSGTNGHPNPSLAHGGSDAQGFQRTSYNAIPPTEHQLGEMQLMEEVAEFVGMNYPEIPDSRYVAQPFDDFLFPWEEGSVDNPITIEEDEGISEPRTPVSEPPVMDARPALRSIGTCKILRTQLLDNSLICK